MWLTAYLLPTLKAAVALLIFAVGLDSRRKDFSYLTQRPGVKLRSLLAISACALELLATHWQVVGAILGPPILTLAGFTLAALGVGHLMGGPDPNDRTALAVTCATRHVGVAMVIAAVTPGPRTVVLIVAYVLASALVIIPYMKWRGRVATAGLKRSE